MSMLFGSREIYETDSYRFVDEPETDRVSRFVLQPGATMTGTSRAKPKGWLTDEQGDQILTGKDGEKDVRLYLYGTVRYGDVFGNTHWTNYCFFYGGPFSLVATGKKGPKKRAFAFSQLHNDIGTEPRFVPPAWWSRAYSRLCEQFGSVFS